MFAIWVFIRYFIIINGASRITEREQALVAFLSDWEQECWEEGEDKRQIQRLHDRLVQNPTEISLGGYVTLNRKLILGVSFQFLEFNFFYDLICKSVRANEGDFFIDLHASHKK